MKDSFARLLVAVSLAILGSLAAAQERTYLADDPKELGAQYLSRIQQIAGMQPTSKSVVESRKQAIEVAEAIARDEAAVYFGYDHHAERTRFTKESSARLLKTYDELVARMPTPYSDWFTLWLIGDRSRDIEVAADDLGYKAAMPPILVGDVPTVCVNAYAVKVSESAQRLVLVQAGMVHSMWHAMSLFVASIDLDSQGFVDTSFEKVRDRIKRSTIAPHFTNALRAATGKGPKPVPQETQRKFVLIGDLHRAATLFVLAHEYAHIILKHTENNPKPFKLKMVPPPGALEGPAVDIVTTAKSREQEFAADKLAFELVVSAAKLDPYASKRIQTMAWAPEVYFAWLELFDASVSQFTDQPAPDYSKAGHPSPAERLEVISEHRAKMGVGVPSSVAGFRDAWRRRIDLMNTPQYKRIYGPFLKQYQLSDCQ